MERDPSISASPAAGTASPAAGVASPAAGVASPAAGCPDEQVILDLAVGALLPEARQRAWAHVERCQQCAGLIGAALPFLGPVSPGAGADPEAAPGAGAWSEPSTAGAATGGVADTAPAPRDTDPPPRSLQPGQELRGRYRIVRHIGRGGMGEVYEVRHARLVGRYALKILNLDLTQNQTALQRFRREAGIASELRHPNIVQVIDFDETDDGRPFLVMELLDGRDLGALVADGPLPVNRVLALARQIAAGLTVMHGLGIVHRDLKPANVFVLPEATGEPERIKLVDFGLSKRVVPSLAVTHDRVLLGTPQYMAPEQARGNSDGVGPAADQFAMAAIVYEMLAGCPAFSGELLSVVLYRIVYEPPPPLTSLVPALAPRLEAAIARGMAKDPSDRFPSVGEFMDALGEGARAGGRAHARDRARTGRAGWTRAIGLSAGVIGAGLGLRWFLMHPAATQETATPPIQPAIVKKQPSATPPISDQEAAATAHPLPIQTAGSDTASSKTPNVRPEKKPKRRRAAASVATHEAPDPAGAAGAAPAAGTARAPAPSESVGPSGSPDGETPPVIDEKPAASKGGRPLVPHL